MQKDSISVFKKLISQARQITIITHWSPDGDAMGSSLGLYNALRKMGKKAKVVVPNAYPGFLHWLPGNKSVLNFEEKAKPVSDLLKKSDLVFILDFNTFRRIEKLGELVAQSKAQKVLVDHHQQPETYFDYYYHDVNACSTCELVYELITGIAGKKVLDEKIASCLYTGIMTDTGSFRFPSTTAKTHKVVAELIEAGAKNDEIYNHVFDDYSVSRLRLMGYCLYEKLTFLDEYKAAYIMLNDEDHKRFNFKKGDTEGLVNYALSVRGMKLSAFFAERDGEIKISFRSKGNFDVNKFARAHFQGGGHKNAAGGKGEGTLKQTVEKFLSILPQYKKQLQ